MDVFMGTILPFAFNFNPAGWQLCQGQIVNIQQYNALFALLGTSFGGNGTQTFGLPDLRGRTLVGQGAGPGLTPRLIGQSFGVETEVLTIAQLPAHTHTFVPNGAGGVVKASSKVGTQPAPSATVNTLGAAVDPSGNNSTNNLYNNQAPDIALNIGAPAGGGGTNSITGLGQPVNIVQPSLVVNFSIAMFGLYPSRN